MATKTDNLRIRYDVDGDGKVKASLGGVSRDLDKVADRASAAGKVIGQALGTALLVGATSAAVALKAAIDRADELSKAAQKIGIATDALSRLAYAAKLSDVELGELQGGLTRLVKAQAEAAAGSEQQASLFKALGIEFKNTDGTLRNVELVMRDLANVFAQLPDGADKTALAVELLGRSGADLIPLLNGGSIALDEMAARASALGVVIDTETGRAAEEFNDRLTDLGMGVQGLATTVAAELLPDLLALTQEFTDLIREGGGVKQVAGEIADGLRVAADVALTAADGVAGLTARAEKLYNILQALSRLNVYQTFADIALGVDRQAAFAQDISEASAAGAREQAAIERMAARWRPGAAPSVMQTLGAPQAWRQPGVQDGSFRIAEDSPRPQLSDAQRNLQEWRAQAAEAKEAAEAEAAARREAAEATREQKRAQAELERAQEMSNRATQEFKELARDLAAEVDGPLAQATLNYERQQAHLTELHADGKLSLEALNEALADAAILYEREADAIKATLTPQQQYLDDLRFEIELLKLGNAEREEAIALRQANADASSQEGKDIVDAVRERRDLEARTSFADDIRGDLADAISDALQSGDVKGAIEAFGDSLRKAVNDRLAESITDWLLGPSGTPAGGAGGGIVDWISGLFGGGSAKGNVFSAGNAVPFAAGGVIGGPTMFPMAGGRFGLMGEAGPEAIMPLARDSSGRLGVRGGDGGSSVTVHQTINVQGHVDRRTASQMAQATYEKQRVALARNR